MFPCIGFIACVCMHTRICKNAINFEVGPSTRKTLVHVVYGQFKINLNNHKLSQMDIAFRVE